MPNWKKLIVSGSDASLNSLNVTTNVTAQSFTGSFSGSFTAPGATTQVVFNSGGSLAASSNFVFSGSNVGIGTASPAEKLHIIGNIKVEQTTNTNAVLTLNPYSAALGTSYQWNLVGANSGQGYAFQIREVSSTYLHINNSAGGSGGNVGIGTTSPNGKLHVVSPDSTYAFSVAGATKGVRFNINSNGTFIQGVDNTLASSYQSLILGGLDLYFQTNGVTDAMYINSSGSVGIGTTSPSYKLDVNGSFNAVTSGVSLTYNSGVLYHGPSYYQFPAGTYYYLYGRTGMGLIFGSNNAEVGRFDLSGNLGIGTSSPLTRLDLRASTNSSITPLSTVPDTTTTLLIGNAGTNGVLALGHDNAGHPWLQGRSVLANQVAEDILINPLGGNVGIGTTSPETKLHVASGDVLISNGQYYSAEGNTGGNYKLAGITTGNVVVIGAIDYTTAGTIFAGGDNVSLTTGGVAGTSRLYINSSGNVGIGTTSPGVTLDVNGSGIRISDATNPNLYLNNGTVQWKTYLVSGGSYNFAINDAVRDVLTLGYNGGASYFQGCNVGIGTTSPSQKLDVAGAISVSGSVIDYEISPSLISPGPGTNIISFTPGTHYAAFVDYVIKDSSTGANQRVGTIMVSISLAGAAAVMNEVTTVDVGNTSAITFSVSYGAPTWLKAANSGITPFDINYMVRYF